MALVLSQIILPRGFFWARDIITIIIMIIMICMLLSVIKLQNNNFIKLAIKFIGVYVLLDAVKAPLNLLDGRHIGDGAALADMTGIPEGGLGFYMDGIWYYGIGLPMAKPPIKKR